MVAYGIPCYDLRLYISVSRHDMHFDLYLQDAIAESMQVFNVKLASSGSSSSTGKLWAPPEITPGLWASAISK